MLILAVFLTKTGKILGEFDDIKKRWLYFYDLPKNSLDILILGNSHAYATYSSNIIDAICETNSFVLASNSQKLEQTYYNLKEALKYQSPKVVIIQSSVFSGDSWKTEHLGDYRVYSNIEGMHFSMNKIEAILAQRPKEDYVETLLPIFRNHNNWNNPDLISDNLFRMETGLVGDYRGFSPSLSEMSHVIEKKFLEASKVDYSDYEINNSDINYLELLRRLADNYNIKILYVMSPKYPDLINETYKFRFNKTNEVISRFGHEYIDFNQLDSVVGLERRSFENGFIEYQHTSYFGAIQVSQHLGNHLKKSYLRLNKSDLKSKDWQERMTGKKEYFLFGNDGTRKNGAVFSKNGPFRLFDSVLVKNVHIFKKAKNIFELVLEFDENFEAKKLEGFKCFLHLYPTAPEIKNIRKESRKHGFENFDFYPLILPHNEKSYFVVREIETGINKIKDLRLGLFKSGTKERSKELVISDIELDL